MRSFLRNNGLSVTVLSLFLLFWVGQLLTGRSVENRNRAQHGEGPLSFAEYLVSAHALEATAENWESEFLQMCAFVFLTACLVQRGSAESRDPAEREAENAAPATPADVPWPVRRGGWVLKIYEHSLSLALGLLFVVSFALHVRGGVGLFNEEQLRLGQPTVSAWGFLQSSQFWFESFQNWQSEFLSIGAMVILSIYLREKGSPESKRVASPHHAHE